MWLEQRIKMWFSCLLTFAGGGSDFGGGGDGGRHETGWVYFSESLHRQVCIWMPS